MGLGGGGGKGGGAKGGGSSGSLLNLPGSIIGGITGGAQRGMGGLSGIPGMLGSTMGGLGGMFPGMMGGMGMFPGMLGGMMNPMMGKLGQGMGMFPGMFPPFFGQQRGNGQFDAPGWMGGQQQQQPPGAHSFTGQGASGQNHMQQMAQGAPFYGGAQPGQSSNLNWGPNAIGGGSGNSFSFGQQSQPQGGSGMPNLQEAPPAPWDQRVNR